MGVARIATIADHVEPHKWNANKFWCGPLQSLCGPHHSGSKQYLEIHGFTRDIGPDGWPIDPNHPVNVVSDGDKIARKRIEAKETLEEKLIRLEDYDGKSMG